FRVILFSIHSDEWKSFQSQPQTALRICRWRYNLTPAESKFKTPCSIIKDKYMMKAQVHVSKSSTIFDVQALPQRKQYAKRIAWSEFSCSMASAVICLATDPTPTPHATPHALPSSPTQEQPTETSEYYIPLLNILLETCATLSQKVVELEQDKHTQALEIIKLKKRVKKLEKKKKSKSLGLKRLKKVGTSQRVESSADTVGRIDDDNAATKDANAVEPIVFDDEEVTMTMAQTLIKMKEEKAKLLDEKIAKRLHDEEVEQPAGREKHEKDDLERAQVLQKKPVSIAQARNNMIIYLKNMVGYKMEHFRGMTYDKVRPIFKREYKKVQTLFKPDKDVEEPQKKRVAEETLHQESFKKLKAVEVSSSESTQDTPTNDPKEMSEEDVQNMLEIFLVSEFKIIRVGGITKAYQSFEDMLKGFDRKDLLVLWRLVKEKFNTAVPSVDKEKALWVELKRLFEPDAEDVLWKLHMYMHCPITWKLYTNYGVHQVSSTTRRHDMFMLTVKDYPLSNRVMTLMLSAKLQVEEDSEMARDLMMKIFVEANKPKSRSLDTSSK
nr:hypothetical protein [Tanacetum cinerariifolium]